MSPASSPIRLVEGTETVIITLDTITASDPGITIGTASDTIDILDGDSATVSIAGTTDGNEAGPVDGVFTVTQTVAACQQHGHRLHGDRYAPPKAPTTTPCRVRSRSWPALPVRPLISPISSPTRLVEGTETVIITLDTITASDPGITIGTASDTIDILDGDSATVSIAGTTDGNETGPVDGVFTVTQTVAGCQQHGHRLHGYRYARPKAPTTTPCPVRSRFWPALPVRPLISPISWRTRLVEGTETVIITLDTITASDPGITIGTASDTINILDGDSATVSIAGTTDGDEDGPVDGVFTVTQTTTAVSDTVIDYTVTGSAIATTDYAALSGTVTITGRLDGGHHRRHRHPGRLVSRRH